VPVPVIGGPSGGQRVLFSIWQTRVQDYEVFVKEKAVTWPKPPFPQGPTHPAVNMSSNDAQAFCAWLTERDRKAGRLGANERYRLLTDHEWSCAVGIGSREDPSKTPEAKNEKIADVFPWGSAWPPPPEVGNYSGEEVKGHKFDRGHQQILEGYRDAFPFTAPVGSFAANRFGLFDVGGNVWEWCEDLFKPGQNQRVVRGGSFGNGERHNFLSSSRYKPRERESWAGFRVAVSAAAPALTTPEAKVARVPAPAPFGAQVAAPPNAIREITIKMRVDASDNLKIRDGRLWIEHLRLALPSSFTINGVPWTPTWNQRVTDSFTAFAAPLAPFADAKVTVTKITGRGSVTLRESPTEANGQTLTVQFQDPANGTAMYEVVISW